MLQALVAAEFVGWRQLMGGAIAQVLGALTAFPTFYPAECPYTEGFTSVGCRANHTLVAAGDFAPPPPPTELVTFQSYYASVGAAVLKRLGYD
jgi:hypothetical protein